jgi:hypothetical protein
MSDPDPSIRGPSGTDAPPRVAQRPRDARPSIRTGGSGVDNWPLTPVCCVQIGLNADLLGRYQEQPIVGVSLARTDPAGSPVSPAEI